MGQAKKLRTLQWKNNQLQKAEDDFFKDLLKENKKKSSNEVNKKEESDGTQSS